MERKTIEQAAKKYANAYCPDEAPAGYALGKKVGYIRGFTDGAKWRINSVWHDASEIAKQGEHIVVVMESGNFTSLFVTPDIAQIFKKFNVILWAYSKDLLPERKEVKE